MLFAGHCLRAEVEAISRLFLWNLSHCALIGTRWNLHQPSTLRPKYPPVRTRHLWRDLRDITACLSKTYTEASALFAGHCFQAEGEATYSNLLRRVQNTHWSTHATREEIYGYLPPISVRFAQRRVLFAGHCFQTEGKLYHAFSSGNQATMQWNTENLPSLM